MPTEHSITAHLRANLGILTGVLLGISATVDIHLAVVLLLVPLLAYGYYRRRAGIVVADRLLRRRWRRA
jgi:hypothetical protein